MSLDKALDELMDGDIIVFQKYVLFEGFDHFMLVAENFFPSPIMLTRLC